MSIAGTSQAAAVDRRRLFIQHYMANGQNATQAAIVAGYSEKTARSQGQRLLTRVDVRAELEAARGEVTKRAELNAENALRVANCVMQSNPKRLFRPDGSLIPIHELDDDTAQALKVEVVDGVVRYGFWPKPEALTQVMRHLGLFDRDNRQQGQNLAIQVNLVGPKE